MKTSAVLALILCCAFLAAQTPASANAPLVVVRNGRYGYIDHRGNIIIEPQFIWAYDFEDGYGLVYVCGRYALVDKSGKLHSIYTPRSGNRLYSKKIGDKFGFESPTGKLKIKPEFDEVLPFSDGMAAAKKGDHWGFIDRSGKFVIPPRFDEAFYFREGVGNVWLGDTTTVFIDKSGKELARGYEYAHGLIAEGRIPVGRDDKYGYLDLTGAVVIPLTFDDGRMFTEGLAAVKKGSKWGYIDTNGSVVIPFQFDSAGEFGNGLAPVKQGGETGFINRAGAFAFHLAFEQAPGFWGLDSVSDVSRFWTKSQEFGYVDTSGNVIWGPIAESPDHAPILGWDDAGKKASCDVLPESLRKAALALPIGDD